MPTLQSRGKESLHKNATGQEIEGESREGKHGSLNAGIEIEDGVKNSQDGEAAEGSAHVPLRRASARVSARLGVGTGHVGQGKKIASLMGKVPKHKAIVQMEGKRIGEKIDARGEQSEKGRGGSESGGGSGSKDAGEGLCEGEGDCRGGNKCRGRGECGGNSEDREQSQNREQSRVIIVGLDTDKNEDREAVESIMATIEVSFSRVEGSEGEVLSHPKASYLSYCEFGRHTARAGVCRASCCEGKFLSEPRASNQFSGELGRRVACARVGRALGSEGEILSDPRASRY